MLGVEVPEFARDEKGQRRDFVVIVNEALQNECTEEARQLVFVVDMTVETTPFPVANYQVREADGAFCERGGRFGAHASHEHFTPIYYRRVMFFSWFNAGVRAVDIRNPYNPREIAYYIPATTEKRRRVVSRPPRASAARSPFRPTTSKSTTVGSSTSLIGPTPACTSWSSPARRAGWLISRASRVRTEVKCTRPAFSIPQFDALLDLGLVQFHADPRLC